MPRDENGADQVTLAAGEAQALLADMAGAIGSTAGSDGFLQPSADWRGYGMIVGSNVVLRYRDAAVDHENCPLHAH